MATALVTGASRGIGRAIAASLAERGWDLVVCARNDVALDQLAHELREHGTAVHTVTADLGDRAGAAAVIERCREVATHLDALVLAAGVGSAGPIAGYPLGRLDKQLAVNFVAPFALVAAALPLLRANDGQESGGGRVIALSSIEAEFPEPGLAAYGATKAALTALVRSINAEEADRGVTATAIAPAFVSTDMSEWVTDRIPRESMIEVADVVRIVDLILSLSANAVIPHVVVNRRGAGAYAA